MRVMMATSPTTTAGAWYSDRVISSLTTSGTRRKTTRPLCRGRACPTLPRRGTNTAGHATSSQRLIEAPTGRVMAVSIAGFSAYLSGDRDNFWRFHRIQSRFSIPRLSEDY
jgi:hypothetical protein